MVSVFWSPYSNSEVSKIASSCAIISDLLVQIENEIKPGITTWDLDNFAEDFILKSGAQPAFKGYHGFKGTICCSVNEEIVHGVPSKKRLLKEGDLVTVDVGCILDGFYSDAARTFGVGEIDSSSQLLIDVALGAFEVGLKEAYVGNYLYNISSAIESYVRSFDCFVVKNYVGHGIGRSLHEEPQVPNFKQSNKGPKLVSGTVIAIEPMVLLKNVGNRVLKDGWTVVTDDGSLSSHYENTIAITDSGTRVLTRL